MSKEIITTPLNQSVPMVRKQNTIYMSTKLADGTCEGVNFWAGVGQNGDVFVSIEGTDGYFVITTNDLVDAAFTALENEIKKLKP